MGDCNNSCSGCNVKDCSSRSGSLVKPQNSGSNIKKVIAVVSGKGGVGKSFITGALSVLARRKGYSTAVLDADITGPSIAKMFGVTEKAQGSDLGIFPAKTRSGIKVISINMMLEDATQPVLWRGPILAGAVNQFWTDVLWGDVDYMFVDMPPGTGDVPLTVFQSLPVSGIVVVTSPQQLVGEIVEKALKMAKMMNIPIIGIAENFSYLKCDCCDNILYPFGKSSAAEAAEAKGLKLLATLPIEPQNAQLCDAGNIEGFAGDYLDGLFFAVESFK